MSSWAAKGANSLLFLLNFFCWVACLDAFGGVMHTLTIPGAGTGSYYYNRIESPGNSPLYYGDKSCGTPLCKQCNSSGDGMVALLVFAWFSLWVSLVFSGARLFSKEQLIPKLNLDSDKCLRIEFGLVIYQTVSFFFALCAWGPCYTKTTSLGGGIPGAKWSPVGLGFLIFCFFMLLLMCPTVWWIKTHPEWHHGFFDSGTTSSAPTSQPKPEQPRPSQNGGEIQNMGVTTNNSQPAYQPEQPQQPQAGATNEDPNAAVVVSPQI